MGEYHFADFKPKREYVQLGNHTIAQFESGAGLSSSWLFADSFESGGFSGNGSSNNSNSEKLTYLYKDALGSTVAKADGTIETLFKPKQGLEYWEKQVSIYGGL